MNITLLSTTVTTVPTAKGSYQVADIAFKNNSFGGKVEGKKIMSFGAAKPAFEVLSVAQPGGNYEVNVVKNEKGYNDWVSVSPAGGAAATAAAAAVQVVQGVGAKPAVPASARTPYETPEERAQRQVYIIRQSSLATAERYHSIGAKVPVAVDVLLTTSKRLEDYVLGVKGPGASGFDDLPDFPKEIFDTPQIA